MELRAVLRQPIVKNKQKDFQVQAHYYADKLNISLKDKYIYMYYKVFKHAFENGYKIALDRAYSYLYDHPHDLTNTHKIKLFVKMYWVHVKGRNK